MTPEAVIVGAGIAGISTAWHLRRAGLSVVLIDAEGAASGASGHNPGFLWFQSKAAGPTMDLALRLRRGPRRRRIARRAAGPCRAA